ncbi:hypothetical protein [Flammeovirga aprica]|uniref:Uncharacterized protein n=1 Tax=Flammeovirga aprica JL-4 TaxID=694437 RepID=A0A7X9P387_9BACT|nr:hypothetical protein [Flammeovirga aprica]NME68525.1 hypothetical protein [Flammeovirga aprica JL-4]
MHINIQEIRNEEVLKRTEDFEKKGGVLHFHIFRIFENYEGAKPSDKYECHLIVAKQIMERINSDMNHHWNRSASKGNRKTLPVYQTNFDNSGLEIGLEEFLGPFYDFKLEKPFVRGIKGNDTINSYFYYDSEELTTNKIDINNRINEFNLKYETPNSDFIYAFMEPPFSIQIGKTIKEQGEYLIEFMNYIFSDLKKIEIMKWSTDYSPYFDAGKEWWGTFFWTVYNPEKDWYIGICGSSTD